MDWNQNQGDYQPSGFEPQQQASGAQSSQNAQASQNTQNTQNTQDSYFFAPPPKKNAAYYRARAREALKGNFWWTVLAALCFTTILSTVTSIAASMGMFPMMFSMASELGESAFNGATIDHVEFISGFIWMYGVVILIVLTVSIFGGGPLSVGYYRLHLDPIDGKKVSFVKLFSGFSKKYWNSVGTYALMLLPQMAVALISLLISIPCAYGLLLLTDHFTNVPFLMLPIMLGVEAILVVLMIVLQVVITYRFRMAIWIIAEYPEMSPVDAMRNSMTLMKGKCWKLFRLELSFIGWAVLLILAIVFSCGLGAYILPYMMTPYVLMSEAAFYDDIANRKAADETEFPSINPDDYDPNQAKW